MRDEEWLVRSALRTPADGVMVRGFGTSTLVQDVEATYFTSLDRNWQYGLINCSICLDINVGRSTTR